MKAIIRSLACDTAEIGSRKFRNSCGAPEYIASWAAVPAVCQRVAVKNGSSSRRQGGESVAERSPRTDAELAKHAV